MLMMLLLLTGCTVGEIVDVSVIKDFVGNLFEVNVGDENVQKDISEPVYTDFEINQSYDQMLEVEERFSHHIVKYTDLVDRMWEKEGYYKKMDDVDKGLSEKEMLIDFYLFMEYHKDTQIRNLQFPHVLQKDLLLIEVLFAKKAIDYINDQEFIEYAVLRDDLVKLYRDMYREEMINILFEGHQQVIIMDRIPNIVDRFNEEMDNRKIKDRLQFYLGIPDTVISRGMGLDLITLYSEMGRLPEGDIRKLAMIMNMEMKLSGINMRLERFFYITNSLEGLGDELVELRKDVDLIAVGSSMDWVRERMHRSINHLEDLYLYYKGEKEFGSVEDVFIKLQTREDFYALNLLGESIKEVMDLEEYWGEIENIKKELEEKELDDYGKGN